MMNKTDLKRRNEQSTLKEPAVEMRKEAGGSFAVADNSVLHQHPGDRRSRIFISVPDKGSPTVPRQHLLY
jgi:hypothetical protein